LAVKNFGGSTHLEILAEKTLVDGDNKSFLLVPTELIVMWLHGDDVYIFSVELMIVTTMNTMLSAIIQLLEKIYYVSMK